MPIYIHNAYIYDSVNSETTVLILLIALQDVQTASRPVHCTLDNTFILHGV